MIEAVLKCGADPNTKGLFEQSPIHLAAQTKKNPESSIKALITHARNLELDALDSRKETALHKTLQNTNLSSEEMLAATRLLLENNANINSIGILDQTPLDLIKNLSKQDKKYQTVANYLTEQGALSKDQISNEEEISSNSSSRPVSPYDDLNNENDSLASNLLSMAVRLDMKDGLKMIGENLNPEAYVPGS
jgi:hypothetical protein